ncbi:MAG: leucine-rich repeat domain-containing protein [Chitinophagaceae bacterium]|nr:leucine-rich repeat domain-containing protein [Chitinophagaceae bacterium]
MKRFSLSVLLAILLLAQTNAQVNSQDSLALINIYNTTNGTAWTQKWVPTQPVNTWFGVTLTAGRVTGLNLPGNNLSGTLLSGNILKLTQLKTLQLQNNHLTGSVPAGIGSLTELEQLDLSSNSFSGTLPAVFFNSLSKLTHFNVAGNGISGWIPSSIGNAAAMVEINVSNNAFTNKIPSGINSLNNLTRFLAANNQLIGPMPVGKLCSADIQVNISGNKFTFSGLECLGANPNAIYNNQHDLNITQNNLTLSIAAGGTLTNNTYTWYRNDPVYGTGIYQVNNGPAISLNVIETGTYRVVITNSQLPELELKSNNITIADVAALRQQDSLVLVDIYNGTKGAQWLNKTNWLTNAPLQDWYGIEVINGRVGNLFLNENNLDGALPGSIKHLTGLKNIEMVKNKLGGLLPDLSRALRLNTIRLSGNNYRGNLPANWGNLVHLTGLELSNNQLKGPIPEHYGNLRRLLTVILSNNQLSGRIPESFSTIGFFEASLDHNLFTGPLPQGFCTNEYISGTIQYNRFNFSGMDCLGSPEMAGRIAYDHQAVIPLINENPVLKAAAGGTLSNNIYKWYKDNVLIATKTGDSTFTMLTSGTYHAIITNSVATELTLSSDTTFFKVVPGVIQDSLALVDIYNHISSGLNWVLTDPISTWSGVTIGDYNDRVVELHIEGDDLAGTLSPMLPTLTELRELYLDGHFTGQIPDDLGRHQPELRRVYIDGKQLTGSIPGGLQNATNLHTLVLFNNQLTGKIPAFFKNLPLEDLNLAWNNLTGTIPGTLSSSDEFYYLSLNNNQLTGPVPPSLLEMEGMFVLDLSHNKLSGPLPANLHNAPPWCRLNNNKFTGAIPSLLAAKAEFDLSNNLLEYVDPVNCGLTLCLNYQDQLNVSNNKLNFTGLECLASISYVCEFNEDEEYKINFNPQQRIPIINENPVLKAAAGGTLANNTYKWFKNTGPFVTKTGDSTLTITTPGVYHCIVTNSVVPGVELRTHNANVSTVSGRKAGPASADNLAGNITGRLAVYPNPTGSGFVYIKGLRQAESVLLYNAAGQLVKQWQNVNGNQQFNFGSITSGVYTIKVVERDKQTMLKFIKH